MDALRRERLRAADVVHVVRVAAVDQDVTALQVRQEIGDGLVDHRGRHHQPHRPRRLELVREILQRRRADGLFLGELLYRLCRHVENHALMAVPDEPPHHVGAHAAESDHSQLHLRSFSSDGCQAACGLLTTRATLLRKRSIAAVTLSPSPNTAVPATSTLAPAATTSGAVDCVDPAVDLHVGSGLDPLEHFADPRDLRERRPDEVLMSETRVDRHDQHLVHVGQDFLQHRRGRRGIDHDPDPLAERLHALHGAVQVVVAFPVDEQRVRPRLDERFEIRIRIGDHQVRLDREPRHRPQRAHDRRPHRNVGYEVSIHDVDVDAVGAGALRLHDLLAQPREIRGEDRRGELRHHQPVDPLSLR